jgi:hypothetical protein
MKSDGGHKACFAVREKEIGRRREEIQGIPESPNL